MTTRRGLFWSEMVLLLAVTWSLAVAEEKTWYATVVSLLCAVAGGWTLTGRKPLLSGRSSAVLIVAGFLFMIADYVWFGALPVITLSHFMILFCVCKLLAERSLRDDGQFLLLCLFMLVVSAVTSGNMLFPVTLFLYLTVGVYAWSRFYLLWLEHESGRHTKRLVAQKTDTQSVPWARHLFYGAVALSATNSLIIGTALFIICPRVGAGAFFGQAESSLSGRSVGGFSPTVDFEHRESIQESEQPVMRVQIKIDDQGSGPVDESLLYFRGSVLNQYGLVFSRYGTNLKWRWESRRLCGVQNFRLLASPEYGQGVGLLPDIEPTPSAPFRTITQYYWMQPNLNQLLFTCYPPLWIGSNDFDKLRKWIDGQELQVENMPTKGVRYVVRSAWPSELPAKVLHALEEERSINPREFVTLPDPPLPRQKEIMALIGQEIGDPDSFRRPEQMELFARRIEAFLRSELFSYTLDPPLLKADEEPIGKFLLDTRRGHCEYFASAMVLMCQFSGLTARLVTGYRGGDFNPIGNFYLVRAKHAHSWVEVYIPGKDWVIFDPTPGLDRLQRGKTKWLPVFDNLFDYLQFCWVTEVMSFDAQSRANIFRRCREWLLRPTLNQQTVVGAIAAFVKELFGGTLPLSRRERAIYWVFALLAVAGTVMVGYALALIGQWAVPRLRRLLQSRAVRDSLVMEVEFYRRFCHLLHDLGLTRRDEQTPAEFAAELAEHYADFSEAPDLVRAYYEVAYGRRSLSTERQTRIHTFLRRLKRLKRNRFLTTPSANISA